MRYYLVFSKKTLMERKAINIFNIINVFIVKTKRKMWLYLTWYNVLITFLMLEYHAKLLDTKVGTLSAWNILISVASSKEGLAGKASQAREGTERLTFHMKGQTSNKNMICINTSYSERQGGEFWKGSDYNLCSDLNTDVEKTEGSCTVPGRGCRRRSKFQ